VEKLEPEEAKQLAMAIKALGEAFRSIVEGDTASEEENTISFTADLSPKSHRAFAEMTQLIMRTEWTGLHAQLERLYRSVIVGLVGQFEVLISDIAHQFFKRAPRALNAEDKVLSLSDLYEFGSVDAAIDYLAEQEVYKLLARSADGWAKFFEQRMNIDLYSMARNWEAFEEFIQRRHVIVHADGKISRRYLQIVSPALVEEYHGEGKVGQATGLDRDYVEKALDHFEILGTLLCCTAWIKLDKESLDEFESTLVDWIYRRLLESRWEMALAMAQEGENNTTISQSTRIICRLNAWLCLKRMGRFGEIREDAEEFDDSALGNRFKVVRLALLDREEMLLDLLEKSEGGGLDHTAWHEWPVLSEIRGNPRFAKLADRFAPETMAGGAHDAVDEGGNRVRSDS